MLKKVQKFRAAETKKKKNSSFPGFGDEGIRALYEVHICRIGMREY